MGRGQLLATQWLHQRPLSSSQHQRPLLPHNAKEKQRIEAKRGQDVQFNARLAFNSTPKLDKLTRPNLKKTET
jgi:hypothetical protein